MNKYNTDIKRKEKEIESIFGGNYKELLRYCAKLEVEMEYTYNYVNGLIEDAEEQGA